MATQNDIRDTIITALGSVSELTKVGNYPDDVYKVGRNFPSAMVGDGDELWSHAKGDRELITYDLPVYVYGSIHNDRIASMNDLTAVVDKAIVNSVFSSEYISNIGIDEIEKGEYSESEDWYSPGFYPGLTIRKLNFSFTYYTCRNEDYVPTGYLTYIVRDLGGSKFVVISDADFNVK